MSIPAESAVRTAVLTMARDIVGEKMQEVRANGKCKDCPVLQDILKSLRLAMIQESEVVADDMRAHYGV
jgi:hypothetical protein